MDDPANAPQPVPGATQRVKASSDPQVEALLTDPAQYFAQARAAARREAHAYVRAHGRAGGRRPRPA